MNKDSKEYSRVREEIASYIFRHFGGRGICPQHTNVYRLVDSILSIEGLAILADDQSLPGNRFGAYHEHSWVYAEAQRDMERAGFKKII